MNIPEADARRPRGRRIEPEASPLFRLLAHPTLATCEAFDLTLKSTGRVTVDELATASLGLLRSAHPLDDRETLDRHLPSGASTPRRDDGNQPSRIDALVVDLEDRLGLSTTIAVGRGGPLASLQSLTEGHLVIALCDELDASWRRFLVGKGLAHILLHMAGGPRRAVERVIGCAAVATRSCEIPSPPDAKRWVMQQAFEELVAIHLLAGELLPQFGDAAGAYSDAPDAELAVALGLPEVLIARARRVPSGLVRLAQESGDRLATLSRLRGTCAASLGSPA